MNNEGKLWQYDANGKKRTYLEYGDIFLYTASETQTLKLSGAAFPALGGSVQLYDTSANERTRLTAEGLNFYTAAGDLSASYPRAFSINSYTPSFTWSNGSTAPTVNNINAVWRKLGNVVQIYMRFNIAAINGSGNGSLVISYPRGVSIDYGYEPSIVAQLYADINYNPQMFVRFGTGSMFVVSGVGGNYSLPRFQTGYHSFIATLILNNEF